MTHLIDGNTFKPLTESEILQRIKESNTISKEDEKTIQESKDIREQIKANRDKINLIRNDIAKLKAKRDEHILHMFDFLAMRVGKEIKRKNEEIRQLQDINKGLRLKFKSL